MTILALAQKLKTLAEKATPGPWTADAFEKLLKSAISTDQGSIGAALAIMGDQLPKDAAYIAAANPSAILTICNYILDEKAPGDVAEIEARHQRDERDGFDYGDTPHAAHADRATLLRMLKQRGSVTREELIDTIAVAWGSVNGLRRTLEETLEYRAVQAGRFKSSGEAGTIADAVLALIQDSQGALKRLEQKGPHE